MTGARGAKFVNRSGGRRMRSTVVAALVAGTLLPAVATAALALTPAPAGAAAPGPVTTVHLGATFTSTNQNLWGPGTDAPPADFTNNLFDLPWNASASAGGTTDVSFDPCFGILGGCTVDLGTFGASISASTNGDIGMSTDLQGATGGSVSVSYPVGVDLTMPANDTFLPGDPVTISSSAPTVGTGSITTTYPDFTGIGLNGRFGFHLNVSGTVCLFGCFLNNATILSLDVPSTGVASGSIFTLTKSDLSFMSGFGLTHCFNVAENLALGLGSYTNPSDPSLHSCGGNGYLAFPDVSVSSTMSGDTVNASGADTYIVIPVSAVTWLFRLAGITLPPGFPNLGPVNLGSGVTVGYTTLNLILTALLKEYQDLSFQGTAYNVSLDLGQSVPYTVFNSSDQVVSAAVGSTVTMPTGDKVTFDAPGPMSITPTLTLADNTFTNHTYDRLNINGELKALSLTLDTPSATCCGGYQIWPGTSINLGPVVDQSILQQNLTGFTVEPSTSWTLGGFAPVTFSPFTIVPDPPPTVTSTPITVGYSNLNVPFTQVVASFSDPDPNDANTPASTSYTAIVDWGDGSAPSTAVTLTGNDSSFTATASHTYTRLGTFTPTVTLVDPEMDAVTVTPPTSTAQWTGSLPLAATGGLPPYPGSTYAFAIAPGSSAPGCTITGTTLTASGTGSCRVTAQLVEPYNFAQSAVSAPVSFYFTPANQSPVFVVPPNGPQLTTGFFFLGSRGGSGPGAYDYEIVSPQSAPTCSLTGRVLTSSAPGTCVVITWREASLNYLASNASPPVAFTFTAVPATTPPTISFASPASGVGGAFGVVVTTGLSFTFAATDSDGSARVSYSVSSVPGTTCTLSATTVSASGPGACVVTVQSTNLDGTYTDGTATLTVIFAKAT